ncbi:hypothetical protein Tco_0145051 [Tanacetum coccineum]
MVAIRRRHEEGQDENQLEENDDDDDCLEYIDYDNLDVAYFDESSPKWHVSTNYALGRDEKKRLDHLKQDLMDVVFDGAFGGVRDEEVVVGEGMVVISLSLDMLTDNCLGGIMVSLIFLEGLDEEALVEFMVE